MENIPNLASLDISKIFFIHSQYLWHVLAAALFVFLLYSILSFRIWALYRDFGGYKKCKKLARLSKVSLTGPFRLFAKTSIMTLLALIIGLTLLEPSIKETDLENEYEPSQIVICLDSSISMLADDVKPSRLEASKKEINALIERLTKEGGKDGLALYRFTDIAIPAVAIPTRDYDIVKHELSRITPNFLDRFKTHGTNIWDAMTQGILAFDENSDQIKILIVVSDGEQVAESEYIDKLRNEALALRNKNENIKIFIVSMGTVEEERSLIPRKKDENGNVLEYYVHELGPDAGKLVDTRPDKQYMEEVASQLSTDKVIVSKSGEELAVGLNKILSTERKITGQKENPELKNLSPLFILASLLLLLFVPFSKL